MPPWPSRISICGNYGTVSGFPVLVLRGGSSALLTAEVAERMELTGPKAKLVTFPGIGHAPALMAEDQIATIVNWLTR